MGQRIVAYSQLMINFGILFSEIICNFSWTSITYILFNMNLNSDWKHFTGQLLVYLGITAQRLPNYSVYTETTV